MAGRRPPGQQGGQDRGLKRGEGVGFERSKVDRAIAKEPTDKGKPRYCLLVFGPQANNRIWLVLDADGPALYGPEWGGDLTTKCTRVEPTERYGYTGHYKAGDITEGDGQARYTNLSVVQSRDGF